MSDDQIKRRRPVGKIVIVCSVAGALLGFGTCGTTVWSAFGGSESPRQLFLEKLGSDIFWISLVGVLVGIVMVALAWRRE